MKVALVGSNPGALKNPSAANTTPTPSPGFRSERPIRRGAGRGGNGVLVRLQRHRVFVEHVSYGPVRFTSTLKLVVPTEFTVPPIQWQLQNTWILRAVRLRRRHRVARTATRSPVLMLARAIGRWCGPG